MTTFNFPVDVAHARAHNELLKDTKRLQVAALVFALIQLAIGAALWFWLRDTMGILAFALFGVIALVFLVLIPVIPKKVGNPQQLYDAYDLVPGVIAEVNPRDMALLALVNLNVDGNKPPRWALALRNVTRIEGHEREKGERVPCVAVSGRRNLNSQDLWDEVSPMPIAWGTADEKIIRQAESKIPAKQWERLMKNVHRLAEVRETKFNLLEL